MVYCGCGTRCARATWCLTLLLLAAAVAGIVAGLIRLIPCASQLSRCDPRVNGACWTQFWQCTAVGSAWGFFLWLAVAGVACLLLSLLTSCCFCCQRSPRHKAQKQDQFVTDSYGGVAPPVAPPRHPITVLNQSAVGHTPDVPVYSDQYGAYDQYPRPQKASVAHV